MTAKVNYIGTVHLADRDTPTQQAGVTASGEVYVTNFPGNTVAITPIGSASALGLSTSYLSCANSTNATLVKNAAGKVFGYSCFNNGAAGVFLKIYNKASAPTVGSDTVFTKYQVPAGTGGAGFIRDIALGQAFTVGIAFAVTANFADSDATAIPAGIVSIEILYL